MADMTSYERVKRMYEHREADRIAVTEFRITDAPWGATVPRWHEEGMPDDVSYVDFFDLDRIAVIHADTSPRYPEHLVEEADEWVISTIKWGATLRQWEYRGGTPEFLDFRVKDPESWAEAKARMAPGRDRVNWKSLKRDYRRWRDEGAWVVAEFLFGFDVLHAWMVEAERMLVAMAERPDWTRDMFDHSLDVCIAVFEMIWDAGYEFDMVWWPDDIGTMRGPWFSPGMYRELLKPVHKRAADWAHARKLKVHLHSCGYIEPLILDLIDAGIDMTDPVQVRPGMDPVSLKGRYGDRLGFHGGNEGKGRVHRLLRPHRPPDRQPGDIPALR